MRPVVPVERAKAVIVALSVLALLALGCGESDAPLAPSSPDPSVPRPTGTRVSEPVLLGSASARVVGGALRTDMVLSSGGAEMVSYVSREPDTTPEADSVEIRNLTRDLLVAGPMVDGGFDPISIPASVDDSLEITTFATGLIFERTIWLVPLRLPPIVIRTRPPRGKTRIPLNSNIVIVFSEPVDAGTLTPTSIRLLRNGTPVAAAIFLAGDGLTLDVDPAQSLQAGSRYEISVGTDVQDLSADPLEQAFLSDFTTIATQLQGEIAFEARVPITGRNELFLMKTDGTDIFQLTDAVNGGLSLAPAFSPDGTKIAFSVFVDGPSGVIEEFEIYSINVDGTGVTNLTKDPAFDGWRPAWSPDGSKIAFFSNRTGDEEIWVMNADGSSPVQLTDVPGSDANPSWSPDGSRIAFASVNDEISIMNADGSGQVNISNNLARDDWPAWSPDGSRIAFQSDRDGNPEIYLMHPDGSGVTRLTNDPASDATPAWSPDGSQIAFDRGGAIYVMNADGTGVTRLADGFFPSWSP